MNSLKFFLAGIVLIPTAAAFAQDDNVLLTIAESQITLSQNATIASPIDGVISTVAVREGDMIAAGQELVRLDSRQAQTELQAAKAGYAAAVLQSNNDIDERYARSTLDVSRRELCKSENANKRFAGAISGTELDKLRLVVEQSELAIEQATHERDVAGANSQEKLAAVEIANARLERHRIVSGISGMVAEVAVQPGEWAEPGKPVVRIISLDPVRVECFLDGRKFGSDLVGNAVKFVLKPSGVESGELPAPVEPIVGEVTFVSPELQPVTGQTRLWAELPNPNNKLRAGMRGKLLVLEKP